MAIYHLEAKVVSRGNGRSACAASAYMSCSQIYNNYDGIQHDYTRKQGLVWQEVFLPENAPPEWRDREKLWNAVEASEKTKDSRLAREFVVALPVELNKTQWQDLLTEFVQNQFVADGMCADVCIHDTDGHNPHAHIMLTVRPLDENGKWQYKTQKEYLCVRNGEERGFTAAEFKTAQAKGWEKQYLYNPEKGKKKIYLSPSEAERRRLTRADKHPKSTKYGRQNPITERWNSEEQLLIWREAWADVTNKYLSLVQSVDRIDHRSHAERGIDEQPTIHEGVTAQALEHKGIISDRRELNRQIKADNRLLRELKTQVRKLTEAVANTIPAVAERLENIRAHMIMLQYHLLHNSAEIKNISGRVDWNLPLVKEYKSVQIELKEKQSEKKKLEVEKSNTSIFSPVKHVQLNKQITTLTEDIEELKTRKNHLMHEVGCQNDTEMKQAEGKLSKMTDYLEKMKTQQPKLSSQIASDEKNFAEIKERVSSQQEDTLLDSRVSLREDYRNQVRSKLRETFGQKFEYDRLASAEQQIDDRLSEDSDLLRERTAKIRHEQEVKRRMSQPDRVIKKSQDYEM
ncbi:MAG: MobA/MobL family protein [Oscillospiraceae bacterium]|nr:MobA/MobL family protein [Oscillospiraceae bacterium]